MVVVQGSKHDPRQSSFSTHTALSLGRFEQRGWAKGWATARLYSASRTWTKGISPSHAGTWLAPTAGHAGHGYVLCPAGTRKREVTSLDDIETVCETRTDVAAEIWWQSNPLSV